jgi:hypothetical protein
LVREKWRGGEGLLFRNFLVWPIIWDGEQKPSVLNFVSPFGEPEGEVYKK